MLEDLPWRRGRSREEANVSNSNKLCENLFARKADNDKDRSKSIFYEKELKIRPFVCVSTVDLVSNLPVE